MVEGTTVKLAGQDFVVPPLTLGALRRLSPKIKNLSAMSEGALPSDEQLEAIVAIIHAALKRNYPELTVEQVEELLDLGTMVTILPVILGAAGLEKKEAKPGEAGSP